MCSKGATRERKMKEGVKSEGNRNGVSVSQLSAALLCFFHDCEFTVFPPD